MLNILYLFVNQTAVVFEEFFREVVKDNRDCGSLRPKAIGIFPIEVTMWYAKFE